MIISSFNVRLGYIVSKYQPSGAGGTPSPPATPHRLQHLTARFIQMANFLNSDGDSLPLVHLKIRRLPEHHAKNLEGEISEEEL